MLGNERSVTRRLAYRCISCFVKKTKKLELVLSLIVSNGFRSGSERARQHSMLVIPVMLSLNQNVIKSISPSAVMLLEAVTQNLNDDASVVQRTAKRLLLELKKHFDDFLPSIVRQF